MFVLDRTPKHLPSSWRLRRPDHRPCIQDWDSLSWWAGTWNIPHWGQIWRVQHRPRTLAAGLWRPQYPWLHSADHSMKPTWKRPLPDIYKTPLLQYLVSSRWILKNILFLLTICQPQRPISIIYTRLPQAPQGHIYVHIIHDYNTWNY